MPVLRLQPITDRKLHSLYDASTIVNTYPIEPPEDYGMVVVSSDPQHDVCAARLPLDGQESIERSLWTIKQQLGVRLLFFIAPEEFLDSEFKFSS